MRPFCYPILILQALLILPILSGCTAGSPPAVSASYRPEGLLLPSKDHLWAAGGKLFSASEFEALEERFPPLSAESRLLLSQYLSLHSQLTTERKPPPALTSQQFAEDLRGLLPPVPSGFNSEAYEKRIRETYQVGSSQEWKQELDRKVRAVHFEWNRALLSEYGLKR